MKYQNDLQMAAPFTVKDHRLEGALYRRRAWLGLGLVLCLTLVLMGRMFYLQVVLHEKHATRAYENRVHSIGVAPPRGLILDRNGELLADNIPSSALTLIVEQIDDLEWTLFRLRELLLITDAEIAGFRRRLARSQPFEAVPLRLRLSTQDIARISVNLHELHGVQIASRLERHYPQGEITAHAVGSVRRISEQDLEHLDPGAYVGTNHVGKTGMERHYERRLLGTAGYKQVETNAGGRIMRELSRLPPRPGEDLRLHLDLKLQRLASELLGKRRGAVVALEPATGGVLALVSKPSYNPNLFITGLDVSTYRRLQASPDSPFFNRALRGQYEPGSTIKPFIGLIGLATRRITPDFTINDPGYFNLPGNTRLYRDWNWDAETRQGGHGEVNLQKAIYRSCNVFFYSLALNIGIDTLARQLSRFGFGEVAGADLSEAYPGLMPSRQWKQAVRGEGWFLGDTVNMGIGQGDLLITPLQLANAVSILANRGRVMQPHMSRDDPPAREERINLGEPWMWDLIVESMEMVVHRGNREFGDNGTAWAYIGQEIPYRMAGKSGTAQVVGIEDDVLEEEAPSESAEPGVLEEAEEPAEQEMNENLFEHAWFVAFAPVRKPQIALAVVVENGGSGTEVAGPVVRALLDAYLSDVGPTRLASGR